MAADTRIPKVPLHPDTHTAHFSSEQGSPKVPGGVLEADPEAEEG